MINWASSVLTERHELSRFNCGVPSLNEWLSSQALRARAAGTAATYVWTAGGDDRVVAYYAITPHLVRRDEVPGGMAGGASLIPGYLLARLALDVTLHGQGLGAELLHDALDRIVTATDTACGRLVVVGAINDNAAGFYRHHGFQLDE